MIACKSRFVLVSLVNFDLQVFTVSVWCGELYFLFQAVEKFVYAREGVQITNCYGVQIMVVNKKAQLTFILGSVHNRWCPFGSGQFDNLFGEYSVYLSRRKYSCRESWPVRGGLYRPDLVAEEVALVFGRVNTP